MRHLPPTRWLSGVLAVAALWVAGCGVSPQPEPPSLAPTIDIELLSMDEPDGGGLLLVGEAGAVKHGTSLSALDLDTTAPGSDTTVRADGSFSIPLAGPSTDAVRLQAFNADKSSDPVDITVAAGLVKNGGVIPAGVPLADCFALDPKLEIGPLSAGESATVKMKNGCTSDVTVGALALRVGSPAWKIGGTTPLVVPVNATRSFTVSYAPHAGDPTDDVLFVELASPETGRRPLTLRGEKP